MFDVAAADRELLGRFASIRCILVDDAQELTSGGIDLLRACRARGIGVVAFGDPMWGRGAFRGATPRTSPGWRPSWAVSSLSATPIAARPSRSTSSAGSPRGSVRRPASWPPSVRRSGLRRGIRAHLPSAVAGRRGRRDRRLLRERHVLDGVPWSSCAVIAHDSRQVAALEAELAAREVPARASGPGVALGAQRAVRDLVTLVEIGMRDPTPGRRMPSSMRCSAPTAGLDPIELRRLRSALRQEELSAGGTRSGAELLTSGLRHPLDLATIDTREARRRRARRDARRSPVPADAHATAHELLWTAWERSGLSRPWREASRGHGPLAEQADRDLDAIVALFQAAKRFTEREPDGRPPCSCGR